MTTSANSIGSGETRSLAWAFAGHLCDKYLFLMCWLKYVINIIVHEGLISAIQGQVVQN